MGRERMSQKYPGNNYYNDYRETNYESSVSAYARFPCIHGGKWMLVILKFDVKIG